MALYINMGRLKNRIVTAMSTPIACQKHNHDLCINTALQQARDICAERGVRLTQQREQVLKLIWQSHKPLGAYTIMELLAEISDKRVAPPTVYRALDFLLEEGFVHRINSLNAFTGCPSPSERHPSHFLICTGCGIAVECEHSLLSPALTEAAAQQGFSCEQQIVEISGLCPSCQKGKVV